MEIVLVGGEDPIGVIQRHGWPVWCVGREVAIPRIVCEYGTRDASCLMVDTQSFGLVGRVLDHSVVCGFVCGLVCGLDHGLVCRLDCGLDRVQLEEDIGRKAVAGMAEVDEMAPMLMLWLYQWRQTRQSNRWQHRHVGGEEGRVVALVVRKVMSWR